MKPYQVNLFNDSEQAPPFLPGDAVFVYNNKKYYNFSQFDCLNRCNNDYLVETAKLNIDSNLSKNSSSAVLLENIKTAMSTFKKLDSIIIFPDEISAVYAAFSIFGSKTTFFASRSNPYFRICEFAS